MASFRRILVGWDGSRDARQALWTAMHLAAGFGGEVVVLGVLRPHRHAEAFDEAEEELAQRRRLVASEVHEAAGQAGLPPSLRLRAETVEADDPSSALGEYATEHGFDLLVVGRHGLDRAVHPRIGGLTEYQVRHSRCPVLVVGSD